MSARARLAALWCAWIIWAQAPSGYFYPFTAFRSLDECEATAARMQTASEARAKDIQRAFLYSCLPDTIDPRTRP